MAIVWPAGYYSIYYSPDEPEWDKVDVHAGGDAAGQLVIDIAGPPDGSGWGGVPQRRLRGGKQISKQRSSSQKMDQCWHLKLHINPSKSEFRTFQVSPGARQPMDSHRPPVFMEFWWWEPNTFGYGNKPLHCCTNVAHQPNIFHNPLKLCAPSSSINSTIWWSPPPPIPPSPSPFHGLQTLSKFASKCIL